MSLYCLNLFFSDQIDMIMLYSDYSKNGVITSCIPTIKRTEKKLVSAVTGSFFLRGHQFEGGRL